MADSEKGSVSSSRTYRVEFVGTAPFGRQFHGERIIRKSPKEGRGSQLSWPGVDVPSDMVWNRRNNWVVEVPEGEILDLLRKEPGFRVLEEK